MITLCRVPELPGVATKFFGPLSEAAFNVNMIFQNVSAETERTDLTFTVGKTELERAVAVLRSRQAELGFDELRSDPNVVKVSVIGVGMRSHAGVAAQMFTALAERGINIQVISTSEINVPVLIAAAYTELAMRGLHTPCCPSAPSIPCPRDPPRGY